MPQLSNSLPGARGYALIAEFDQRLAVTYQQYVEEYQLDAVIVRDGGAARATLAARGAPALLVADLSLSVVDGLSLVRELRRLPNGKNSAVIVYSAFPEIREGVHGETTGLDIAAVLDKFAPAEDFRAAIRQTVGLGPGAATVRSIDPLQQLLQDFVRGIARTWSLPMVAVAIDIQGHRWSTAYINVVEPLSAESQLSQSGLFSHVIEHQQPLVVPDTATAVADARSPWFSQLPVHGYAAIPIATSGRKGYGVLTVADVKPLALGADQIDAMLMAGRLLADDIEHRNAGRDEGAALPKPAADTWEALALTDPLTGLYNRRAGEQAIAREAARVRRMGSRVSIAMFDLDHFKVVNDTHGHDVGDKVLTEIGRILRSSFRQSDLAIRWGGDEFVVLLPDVSLAGAGAFADRARRQVEALSFSGIGRVTLSAGVAEMDRDEEPSATLKRADTYLYEAKAAGRNRTKGSPPNSSSSASAAVIAS